MTSMLWMSADLKEEEEIHNPTDQLWKLTDNQQLFPVQVSRGFKSCKELDEEKTPLWCLSSAKSAARSQI